MRRLLPVFALPALLAPAAQAQVDPGRAPIREPATPADKVVAFAKHQLGVPYRWGGSSRRTGFDCSGLVYAAYRSIGRKIPHSTWGQMALGSPVGFRRLRPGDLVFTNGGGHVDIAVSSQTVISAPHTGARVRYVSLNQVRGEFVGARRLLR